MADIKPWLEMELANQFRPVIAPENLWDRIQSGPAPRCERRFGLAAVALATAALLLAVGFGFRLNAHQRDLTQLTDQDLRAVSDAGNGSSFPSNDPVEIRKWLKDRGNFEISLPAERTTRVRLLGAKLVELRGTLIAAVAYHVGDGDHTATLLVCRKKSSFWDSAAQSGHLFTRVVTHNGSSLISWNSGNQNYAVAWAGQNDARGACLLCHADAPARL